MSTPRPAVVKLIKRSSSSRSGGSARQEDVKIHLVDLANKQMIGQAEVDKEWLTLETQLKGSI
jgi:hypothetical protein